MLNGETVFITGQKIIYFTGLGNTFNFRFLVVLSRNSLNLQNVLSTQEEMVYNDHKKVIKRYTFTLCIILKKYLRQRLDRLHYRYNLSYF